VRRRQVRKVLTGSLKVRGMCARSQSLRFGEEEGSEQAVLESREKTFGSSTHKPATGEESPGKPISGEGNPVQSRVKPAGADNTERNTTRGSLQQAIGQRQHLHTNAKTSEGEHRSLRVPPPIKLA